MGKVRAFAIDRLCQKKRIDSSTLFFLFDIFISYLSVCFLLLTREKIIDPTKTVAIMPKEIIESKW